MFNIEKHKLILIQILKEIYSAIDISASLGFKGGTVLYLFYGLPRFSVDLDFNLLDERRKELVFEKLDIILQKFGTLKEKDKKRFTLFFLLSYGEKERNVRVEISVRNFPDNYEVKNYLGIPMLVMKKEDMFAHKLADLLDRKNLTNRDLFDIWFFMKERWAVNKELLELRVGTDLKTYLDKCIDVVSKVNNTYILQGLGEILNEKMKDEIKKHLKEELLFLFRFYKESPVV